MFRAAPVAVPAENIAAVSGPLDGMDFVGTFGPVEETSPKPDTLHFRNGYFWSSGCTECGFPPGTYWSRTVGDSIEFQGVLESPERGRFTYHGTVRDGEIEVRVNWLRERWYWTVNRDYRFAGKAEDMDSVSLEAAWERAAGEDAPTCPS